jgi:hypothetical protein
LTEAKSVLAAKNETILALKDSIRYLKGRRHRLHFWHLSLAFIAEYKAGMVGLYQKMREKLKSPAAEVTLEIV